MEEIKDIIVCPKCRRNLIFDEKNIYCPECNQSVYIKNRLLDFSNLSQKLPLNLSNYIQTITEHAGQLMSDLEINWRVESVLNSVINNAHGSTCLEIGGADGPMTPTLERMFGTTISLDYSKEFLKRIEAKTQKAICIFSDAHFLPIQDNTIDTIVCSEVLEHTTIPTQFLTELNRVIKKDGVIILSVPNETRFTIRKKGISKNIIAGNTHINFYTPETLQEILYRTGFDVVEIKGLLPSVHSLKGLIFNMLRFIYYGFYGSFILCTLKPMKHPWKYWDEFYNKINDTSS